MFLQNFMMKKMPRIIHKDIIWSKDILLECQTKEDFYNLIYKSFPNEIEICNVLNANAFNLSDTYGLDCRYSDHYVGSNNPNNYTNYIFKTVPIPLPSTISWNIRYAATSDSTMGMLNFRVIDENNKQSVLFGYYDAHNTSAASASNDGGFIADKKVISHNTSGAKTWSSSLQINDIYQTLGLDLSKKYSLCLLNSFKYASYSTAKMFITKLEIKW